MYHIFLSVCFSGSISINVEQKCSYGTGSGWNPLFLPLYTHSLLHTHTHVQAGAQQRNSSSFQHGTVAWKRCGTWSFSRKWHTGTHCSVHSLVWVCVCVCFNVPSVCSWCQALMAKAPAVMCVRVCSRRRVSRCVLPRCLTETDERWRQQSLDCTGYWESTQRITHTQRSVQGVSVVCSLSLHPFGSGQANQSGLALPRTQPAQRLDLHKSSESLRKGFCFFAGKSLPRSDDRWW